jgi:hypothetical protein
MTTRVRLADIMFFTAPLKELSLPGDDPMHGERGSDAWYNLTEP